MANKMVTLKSDKTVKMLKSAKEQEVKINHLCKVGFCGKCTVKVLSGEVSAPTKREIKKLGEEAVKEGYRLTCQAEFSGDVTFEHVSA